MRSMISVRRFHAAPFLLVLAVSGCGGGGGGGATPPAQPQGPLTIAPAAVKITSVATPASVTLSEIGYGGPYTVNASACSGIASVATPSPGSYTITGIAPGQCAMSFTDSFGQSVALPVSVTVSQVVAK